MDISTLEISVKIDRLIDFKIIFQRKNLVHRFLFSLSQTGCKESEMYTGAYTTLIFGQMFFLASWTLITIFL